MFGSGSCRICLHGEHRMRRKRYGCNVETPMKNLSRIGFVFTVAALLSPLANGAWTKVHSDVFESVFAITDRIILASSYNTLFRSIDSGKTWAQLAVAEMDGYLMKDSIVFACQYGNGMWRSYDSGLTWKSVYTYQGNANVGSLCKIGNRLLAGTDNGIYYSDNNGLKWINTRSGLTDDSVRSLFVFGNTVTAKTGKASFRSSDSGLTWTGFSSLAYTALAVNAGYLYAATETEGLNRSIDSGKTWEPVYVGSDFKRTEFLSVYDGNVFFGNNYGLFLIEGNGPQWTDISSGSHKHQEGCIAIAGKNMYCGFWSPSVDEEVRRPVSELVDILTHGPEIDSSLWLQTNGPCGGSVSSITWGDTALFAATSGEGVYRSLNNGLGWTRVRQSGASLAIIGNSVFAAHDSIVRTSDNGKSWLTVYKSGIYDISCVAVFRNLLYAGGWQTGVLSSANNGVTWEELRTGLESYNILSFGAAGSKLLVGASNGLYTFREGYYYAPDAYEPPKWICSALQGYSIYGLAGDGAVQFAATSRGLAISNDSGKTWQAVPDSALSKGEVACVAQSGNALFAGKGDVFRSMDNAATWQRVLSGGAIGGVACLKTDKGIVVAGFNGGGVYRSADNGETWQRHNSGITSSRVSCLAMTNGRLFAGTANAGIHRSTGGGNDWTETSAGLSTMRIIALSAATDALYAATENRGVFRSLTAGESWSAVNAGLPDSAMTCLGRIDNTLFAGTTKSGVYALSVSGTSWSGAGLPGTAVRCLAANGAKLFAGTQAGVYATFDKGTTWTPCGLGANAVNALALAEGALIASTESGLFYSFNSGSAWTATSVGSAGNKVNALASIDDAVFAGVITGSSSMPISRIYRSGDKGVTWIAVDSGLPLDQRMVTSFASDGIHLFAGTDGRGVWRRPMLQITAIGTPAARTDASNSSCLRMHASVRRSGAIAVEFMLSGRERVCIQIFSVSGRSVAAPVNSSFGPGSHTVLWNSRNFAAGCYLVRLESSRAIRTQRMFFGN